MLEAVLPQQRLVRAKDHVLFSAFEQAEYGRLSIILPGGERREFIGPKDGPVAQWRIYEWEVLNESVARGEIGFAESYMQKRWDTPDLTQLICFMLANSAALEKFFHGHVLYALWMKMMGWLRQNSRRGSRQNIRRHYDLGNAFYSLWLDESMTYSCGLFQGQERTLEEAQAAKYARILDKLDAKPGEHILEIGCGWGGFAEAAAKRNLRVTGITLSTEQAYFAKERLQNAQLDHLAKIQLIDYREIDGTFDYIASIGMFEHVGKRYWPAYFRAIKKLLKPGGKAMVQSITLDDALFEKLGDTTGFIEKYIFPGGMLPSKTRFRQAATSAGLSCHELFAFGQDYARTLSHWLSRFENNLPEVRALGYDETFIRMWRFYLESCIATFLTRRSDVMQAELTS